MELELICKSWRNNGLIGGVPEYENSLELSQFPEDFDVISVSGKPKQSMMTETGKMSFYVIGGVANQITSLISRG